MEQEEPRKLNERETMIARDLPSRIYQLSSPVQRREEYMRVMHGLIERTDDFGVELLEVWLSRLRLELHMHFAENQETLPMMVQEMMACGLLTKVIIPGLSHKTTNIPTYCLEFLCFLCRVGEWGRRVESLLDDWSGRVLFLLKNGLLTEKYFICNLWATYLSGDTSVKKLDPDYIADTMIAIAPILEIKLDDLNKELQQTSLSKKYYREGIYLRPHLQSKFIPPSPPPPHQEDKEQDLEQAIEVYKPRWVLRLRELSSLSLYHLSLFLSQGRGWLGGAGVREGRREREERVIKGVRRGVWEVLKGGGGFDKDYLEDSSLMHVLHASYNLVAPPPLIEEVLAGVTLCDTNVTHNETEHKKQCEDFQSRAKGLFEEEECVEILCGCLKRLLFEDMSKLKELIEGNPLYEKGMVEWGEEQVKELVNARGETESRAIQLLLYLILSQLHTQALKKSSALSLLLSIIDAFESNDYGGGWHGWLASPHRNEVVFSTYEYGKGKGALLCVLFWAAIYKNEVCLMTETFSLAIEVSNILKTHAYRCISLNPYASSSMYRAALLFLSSQLSSPPPSPSPSPSSSDSSPSPDSPSPSSDSSPPSSPSPTPTPAHILLSNWGEALIRGGRGREAVGVCEVSLGMEEGFEKTKRRLERARKLMEKEEEGV